MFDIIWPQRKMNLSIYNKNRWCYLHYTTSETEAHVVNAGHCNYSG